MISNFIDAIKSENSAQTRKKGDTLVSEEVDDDEGAEETEGVIGACSRYDLMVSPLDGAVQVVSENS